MPRPRGDGDGFGHHHDDSFDLQQRPDDARPDPEHAPAQTPSVSNQAQAARAARDRGDAELSLDDLLHQFAASGAPPMPPPPVLGGGADRPAAPSATGSADDTDAPVSGPGGLSARRAPPLPAPPSPLAPIEGSPWLRRR